MSTAVQRLEFAPAFHTYSWMDGKYERHPESHYLDFRIDGRSLLELSDIGGTYAKDVITKFSAPDSEEASHFRDELAGRTSPAHPELGVPLYTCAIDRDELCGFLAALIEVHDDTVTWSRIAWCSPDWDGPTGGGEIAMSVTDTGLGPMVFDRDQYEHTLAEAVPRVDDLPFDVTEFRGKRFLWPWEWGWRV